LLLNLERVKAQGKLDRDGVPQVDSNEGLDHVFALVKLAYGEELAHDATDRAAKAWVDRETRK
jgi:hypothetical protein